MLEDTSKIDNYRFIYLFYYDSIVTSAEKDLNR
jgi:hypothetical protein